MIGLALALALAVLPVSATAGDPAPEIPPDELLTYRITWLGLHCGDMTLESRIESAKPPVARLEMRVRSTSWFDSIYRVRSVVTSLYDQRRTSTRSYHEISSEKDKIKDDLWVVQLARGRARRTKNGEVAVYEVPGSGVLDPLALLYRIRGIAAPGEQRSITVMTSQGALEAKVVTQGWEQVERPDGPVPALRVVQEAVGDEEFGRGGSMTLWLSADADRVPYRIEFELPFGDLVATLYDEEEAPLLEVEPLPEGS